MLMEFVKTGLPEEEQIKLEERMRKNREFAEAEAKYEALLEKIEKMDSGIKNELDSTIGAIMLLNTGFCIEYGIREGIKFIIQCLMDM